MASAEDILKVRYELADTDPVFQFLSDSEIVYFLDKNEQSVRRSMLDCAKTILFKLSMRGDETVDIFSFKGSKAAEAYKNALHLFIKNPAFNPALTLAAAYAGGISRSDIEANEADEDVNAVVSPVSTSTYPDNYFEV
jgi:hypothetical protein